MKVKKTGPEITREIEEKEKTEVIHLLSQQLAVEKTLVSFYEEKEQSLQSKAVKLLLHMMYLDSMKHIDICQVVTDVLRGEDVLKEEKTEIIKELKLHIELEREAIATANKVLKNIWMRQNQGLESLIKMWRDNEIEHHNALKKLMDKRFFRMDPYSLGSFFRDTDMDQLEARYKRSKRIQKYLRK